MGKHNYSKDFKKDNAGPEVEETVEVTEEQNVEPEVEETVEVTEEQNVESEVEESTVIIGVVTNCEKLNVRVIPQQYGKIRQVINESSKVQIDKKESTDEYYKVYTESGIEGYCKKEFITIE